MRTARPLFLHHSALSPDEYSAFTLWLAELLPPPAASALGSSSTTRTQTPSSSDQDDLDARIRVDDVGRFLLETLHVQEETWEDVLSIFHPTHRSLQPRNSISQSHLRALPPLRGGEVFAVFRLVGHANAGKPVHIEGKRLIFWQTAPPLPSTESLTVAAKPYPASRLTAKPPPPPQHLGRKPSTTSNPSSIGHRSTSSLSSKPKETAEVTQPPPPTNPNPFRRGSQSASAAMTPKGGYPSSDSDGLRKVSEDVLTVDSSASSSSEDQGGRNHHRWQTPMGGRDDSDSKHSGEGVGPRSRSKSGGAQSSEPFLSVSTSSSALSPQVAAKLGLSPQQLTTKSVSGPTTPSPNWNRLSPSSVPPLAINVVPSPSSNPFRTRLDSASGTALSSLPDKDHSPLSPPLPPRPSQASVIASTHRASSQPSSIAPPLPPREATGLSSARASAGGSSMISDQTTSSVRSSPTKNRPVPPIKPPKPNSFHTTPLIQQSLLAAKGARKQEEKSASHERKFEVIGSSSSSLTGGGSGTRTRRSGSGSGTDPLGISPVTTGSIAGGGGSKFATVNASFGLAGGAGPTRSHRSHSLAMSGGSSPFKSPPIIASARPEREYPFPSTSPIPPPPPSTVILNPSKPLPPPRRNSAQVQARPPPPPPPPSSTLLNRHVSLSSARSRVTSGDPLKDGLRAMEQGVGWLKDSAAAAGARGRGGRGKAAERERLVGSDDEEGEDSGDERRRERRREMERESQGDDSWRRLD